MIVLSSDCLKILSSFTTGTTPLSMMSDSTFPDPLKELVRVSHQYQLRFRLKALRVNS